MTTVATDPASRDGILAAAHTVFMRRGTSGARMQEIAREAGVNKALLHYYFGTKQALADAVFRTAASNLLPTVFEVVGSTLPLEEKIELIVARYIGFLRARPYLPGYLISELHADPERAALLLPRPSGAALAALQEQLDAGARDGALRPIRAEHFLINMVSMIIFPFLVRPMLDVIFGIGGDRFDAYLTERQQALPIFIRNGLRP